MTKDILLKRIAAAIDAAESSRMYGKLEIEFVEGVPIFLRELKQEKLTAGNRKEVIQNAQKT